MTYRLAGHYVGDSQHYRSKEERAAAMAHCPIQRLRQQLAAEGVTVVELDTIADNAEQEVRAAVEAARAAPRPDAGSVLDYVYSAPIVARTADLR
jgi:TPP-dependent pyruvate/acetoin dehydrogenase alpha subunit